MARKPMVTRTIVSTKVNVMCLDISKGEPYNEVVIITGEPKEDKLMKLVSAKIDNDTHKAVHIVDKERVEELYGMYEEDFIANAVVLDPTTRKAIEEK